MLSNYSNKLLYVGSSSNLSQRVHRHKIGYFEGHTKKYNINRLIYFETYTSIDEAIKREQQIKSYNRSKKNKLINKVNPQWRELEAPLNNF
jgi:putative endonuclease